MAGLAPSHRGGWGDTFQVNHTGLAPGIPWSGVCRVPGWGGRDYDGLLNGRSVNRLEVGRDGCAA
jgi:hypothetical protein